MPTFDGDLLSEEHLDNIENDNEGDDDVYESSSEKRWRKWSPCHCKMLFFAFYSNQYMATTKTEILWDKNCLNKI